MTPFVAKDGNAVSVLGSGKQALGAGYREDVVEAIVRAFPDDGPSGRFDLTGPEVMTVDDFVRFSCR